MLKASNMSHIEVVAKFTASGGLAPEYFKDGNREYKINSVNLVRSVRRGARRIIVFNVSDEGGEHILIFDTENLKWQLETNHGS